MTYTPITRGQTDWDVPVNAAFVDQDTRITTNAANISTVSSTIAQIDATSWQADDQGFLAMSTDPILATGSSGALTSGTVYLHRFKVTSTILATNLWHVVAAAGGTLTSGQNFAALYNGSGTQLAVTADLTTDWGTTGLKTNAFTSSVSLSAGVYYMAFLSNGTTGVNLAKTATFTSGAALNANLSASTLRASTGGTGLTGLTALPSSITMSNRSAGTNTIWFAIT